MASAHRSPASTAKPWRLRYFEPGDERAILECVNSAFGSWPGIDLQVSPIEHLEWKLGAETNGRRYHIIAAEDSRIIACGLVRAWRAQLRGRTVDACFYGDMAVLPEFQGKGIMGEVWDHQEGVGQAFALSMGLSGNPRVNKEYGKRSRSRALANRVQVFEKPVAEAAAATGLEVHSVDRFDERYDELYREASQPFEFSVVRDQAWLNYRYTDRRAGRFAARAALEGSRLLGYSVLAERAGKGVIADLLALPDRPDALSALLADAEAHCALRGVDRVRCWLPSHHPYRPALVRSGFAPLRDVDGLMMGPFGATDMEFIFDDDRAALHYTAGDTDVV